LGSALLLIRYFMIVCTLRRMDSCLALYFGGSREDLSNDMTVHSFILRNKQDAKKGIMKSQGHSYLIHEYKIERPDFVRGISTSKTEPF